MKKIVSLIICGCMLFFLCSCGKVDNLIKKIDDFSEKENIMQTEIDTLFEEYNNLSAEEKEKITNYNKLEKYENVNIDNVKSLENRVNNISENSEFSDISSIYDSYKLLNENEQNLIDITGIEEKMQLSNLEKATVSACQYIKKSLKNSSSFELISAKAIDDIGKKSNYYLVNIQYSATNGFGAQIDDTSFQTISSEFKNPWYGLAMLNGDYSTALECTPFIEFYLLNEQKPVEVNCDKILYYLDTEFE